MNSEQISLVKFPLIFHEAWPWRFYFELILGQENILTLRKKRTETALLGGSPGEPFWLSFFLSACRYSVLINGDQNHGVPTKFLDKRIKFTFGRDKWIKSKFWGWDEINSDQDWIKF